ncbi:MAG: hypothetical protein IPN86_05030 [Saprospiraceae bacterium]|nr:hypothetical protein [Saprospiraceae bacterium]
MLWSNDHVSRSYRKFYYSFYQNEIGILRGSHIGNLTDLKEAFTREEPFFTQDTFGYAINAPRQNVQHHLAKYSHKYTFSDAYSLNVDAALQVNLRQEYDVRRGGRSNTPSLDLSLFSQFYDIQLNRRTEDTNLQHSVGIQYKNNNNTNNPGTGIRPLIPNYLNHQIALYAIFKEQWHAIPLEFGLRSEYRKYNIYRNETAGGDAHHDFLNIGANLGLKKQITKLINATLDISYTQRPAEVNELYSNGLHQGVSGIEEGNTKLTSEKSFKIVHEWNGHINHHHHINMAFFYNKFWQYIYLQPTDELRLTIRGAFPVFRYVGADVNMAGFSFKSNWNINHKLLWSNAIHYTYAQNLTLDQGLIRIPPLNTVSNISYTLGKSKAYSEMKIGTELSYTAKQTSVNVKEDFLSPPESYFLINAFIRAKWKTTKQNDLDLIVRCENLLNSTYRDYLNRLRYFADEMGRNIYVSINMSF